MPNLLAGETATIANITKSITGTWQMSLQSVHFMLFLPIAIVGYFLLPKKMRQAWLLLASYYFYFFAAPLFLPVLLIGTLFGFFCGKIIAASKDRRKKIWLWLSVGGAILGLCFFKYNTLLFSALIRPIFNGIGLEYNASSLTTVAALGVSYYTFTTISYLVDVSRGDVPPEKNIISYALFIGFFPYITMGPIVRAGNMLPQLKNTDRKFDVKSASSALLLMCIGFFKKLAVADTLNFFVSAVYSSAESLQTYSGFTLSLAAVLFMLQLYFDFSGYCDIGMGAAQLLGIKLPQNFNNPYFSTNFSGFWSRWHMSLSTWLQDYVFTPLVWSRWTEKLPIIGKKISRPPMLSSLVVVFLVSGLWHGDNSLFLVWGLLQAVFRIGEELLHRHIGKPKKNPPLWKRIGKTAIVLFLWTQSLVFFKVGLTKNGNLGDAFSVLLRQFQGLSITQTGKDIFAAVHTNFFSNNALVILMILFSVGCLLLALWADWLQCFKLGGKSLADGIMALPKPAKWAIYFFLVLACFAAFLAQSGGFSGANFVYNYF